MKDNVTKIIHEIVSSRHDFAVGSECAEESLQMGFNDGVEEVVLSHFRDNAFSGAVFSQDRYTKQKGASNHADWKQGKTEPYDIIVDTYTLGDLRVKAWHDWIDQHAALEVLDGEKVVERYRPEWWGKSVAEPKRTRDGKAHGRWERFRYDSNITPTSYVHASFAENIVCTDVRFLEFQDRKLVQSEGIIWNELWHLDCVVGTLCAKLGGSAPEIGDAMSGSRKGVSITLTKATDQPDRYIVLTYTNRPELALEDPRDPFASTEYCFNGTAFISSVGLSHKQPLQNAFFYQDLSRCVSRAFGMYTLDQHGLTHEANGEPIWHSMSFNTDPAIILTRGQSDQIDITSGDVGKATFPLRINTIEFQRSLIQKALYR